MNNPNEAILPTRDARKHDELETIIIRAHFLSMDIRDVCAQIDIAPPEMSLTVSSLLKSWAVSYAAALRAAQAKIIDGA
jgi:hypothetical protein